MVFVEETIQRVDRKGKLLERPSPLPSTGEVKQGALQSIRVWRSVSMVLITSPVAPLKVSWMSDFAMRHSMPRRNCSIIHLHLLNGRREAAKLINEQIGRTPPLWC